MTDQHGRGPICQGRREVRYTKTFRKDLEIAKLHRKCNVAELQRVMETIERNEALDKKYKDHALRGRYPDQKGGHTDCRECHVCNDWLLIYRLPDDGCVHFIRTGTHSDMFG